MNQDPSLNTSLIAICTVLFGVVTYFVQKTYNAVDKISEKIEKISAVVLEMRPKVDILWKDRVAPAASPRQLNQQGADILAKSGIKEIVDQYKEQLLQYVKSQQLNNPYDAEQVINTAMMNMAKRHPELDTQLKEGAYKVGADVQTVLFVGAIYLRNQIFETLGFKLDQLDTPEIKN